MCFLSFLVLSLLFENLILQWFLINPERRGICNCFSSPYKSIFSYFIKPGHLEKTVIHWKLQKLIVNRIWSTKIYVLMKHIPWSFPFTFCVILDVIMVPLILSSINYSRSEHSLPNIFTLRFLIHNEKCIALTKQSIEIRSM